MPYKPPEPRCWSYSLPGGWEVLAGKTDADNDRLSIAFAHPNDWWFHVHGMPGSHVLLRWREGEEPNRQTLEAAAAIAAWHSKARTAGIVAVLCTRAKNVSKPRGAEPGSVCSKRDRILKVRPGLPPEASTGAAEGRGP
jgi:predicted ribosome quality control (RQC) complex YloA/Tae2 family protein